MTKGTNTADVRRLEKRWKMLLSNKLHYQDVLTKSEALKKANLACKILDALGKGTVTFSYRKKNGERRYARGTLCKGVSYEFDHYERVAKKKRRDNSNTDGVYLYWDIPENCFRSFRAAELIEMTFFVPYKPEVIDEPIVVEPEHPGHVV